MDYGNNWRKFGSQQSESGDEQDSTGIDESFRYVTYPIPDTYPSRRYFPSTHETTPVINHPTYLPGTDIRSRERSVFLGPTSIGKSPITSNRASGGFIPKHVGGPWTSHRPAPTHSYSAPRTAVHDYGRPSFAPHNTAHLLNFAQPLAYYSHEKYSQNVQQAEEPFSSYNSNVRLSHTVASQQRYDSSTIPPQLSSLTKLSQFCREGYRRLNECWIDFENAFKSPLHENSDEEGIIPARLEIAISITLGLPQLRTRKSILDTLSILQAEIDTKKNESLEDYWTQLVATIEAECATLDGVYEEAFQKYIEYRRQYEIAGKVESTPSILPTFEIPPVLKKLQSDISSIRLWLRGSYFDTSETNHMPQLKNGENAAHFSAASKYHTSASVVNNSTESSTVPIFGLTSEKKKKGATRKVKFSNPHSNIHSNPTESAMTNSLVDDICKGVPLTSSANSKRPLKRKRSFSPVETPKKKRSIPTASLLPPSSKTPSHLEPASNEGTCIVQNEKTLKKNGNRLSLSECTPQVRKPSTKKRNRVSLSETECNNSNVKPFEAKKNKASNKNKMKSKRSASQANSRQGDSLNDFDRHVRIEDRCPDRITNPLLELPPYPHPVQNKGSQAISCSFETNPQATELLSLMSVYFPEPDTFPISYLARLLGFDVPASAAFVDNCNNFDPMTVPVIDRSDDTWLQIPSRGGFFNYFVNANGYDDEIPDPILENLINDVQGEHSESFIDSQTVHQHGIMSHDCIDFAREKNIIHDDVYFRTVLSEDGELLKTFNSGQGSLEDIQSLKQLFTSPGDVIILALSRTSENVIGYIKYSFMWYKLNSSINEKRTESVPDSIYGISSAARAIKKDKTSELILKISNLELLSARNEESIGEAIVLVALATEHARRLNVWYGMIQTNARFQSLCSTYFRMKTIIERKQGSSGVMNMIMIADLHCFSYKYAFLRRDEINIQSGSKLSVNNLYERLIVRLPNKLRRSATSQSSIREYDRTKPVIFRFLKPTDHASDNVQTKYPQNDDCILYPSEAESCNQKFSACSSWDVLKCFTCVEHDSFNSGASGQDRVLSELERQQNFLSQLESSLFPTLRKLLMLALNERQSFESLESTQRRVDEINTIKAYNIIVERRKEAAVAWQSQLEQDMDAVCDVCYDGEVAPDNQIIFCDSCNVAVHQNCYRIERIPDGDFFCDPCRYFKRDRQTLQARLGHGVTHEAPSPLPLCCELCPRRQGAFFKTSQASKKVTPPDSAVKWVHAVCAKWQGFVFTNENDRVIEDVSVAKIGFLQLNLSCCLCLGKRGTYNKCRVSDCTKWMHVTCARTSGLCNVFHGENHEGLLENEKAWSLLCPNHSTFDSNHSYSSDVINQLMTAAKSFPVESLPLPQKPFHAMNPKERKLYLDDPDNEIKLFEVVFEKPSRRCAICDDISESNDDVNDSDEILTCSSCFLSFHKSCFPGSWDEKKTKEGKLEVTCVKCHSLSTCEDMDTPVCHMCNCDTGLLMKASAKPVGMKRWKNVPHLFKKSLFGRDIWCHAICAMWCDKVRKYDNKIADCSDIIMSDGLTHIEGNQYCLLCGRKDKIKAVCPHSNCRTGAGKYLHPSKFHITCARHAGLELSEDLKVCCFIHSDPGGSLPLLLSDLVEISQGPIRTGKMSMRIVNAIFERGIPVIRSLGWAWRWVDWWVLNGMTDKSVQNKGTKESRREDARKCRLAAFGAALRNRDYDNLVGDDRKALDKALRAILHIPSLVGSLSETSIDFLSEWLGRIYRSKSPLLGLGKEKILVAANYEEDSPVFYTNGSPKYELGDRPLPGKQSIADGDYFETVRDPDGYDTVFSSPPKLTKKRPLQDAGNADSKIEKRLPSISCRKTLSSDFTEASKEQQSPILPCAINTDMVLTKTRRSSRHVLNDTVNESPSSRTVYMKVTGYGISVGPNRVTLTCISDKLLEKLDRDLNTKKLSTEIKIGIDNPNRAGVVEQPDQEMIDEPVKSVPFTDSFQVLCKNHLESINRSPVDETQRIKTRKKVLRFDSTEVPYLHENRFHASNPFANEIRKVDRPFAKQSKKDRLHGKIRVNHAIPSKGTFAMSKMSKIGVRKNHSLIVGLPQPSPSCSELSHVNKALAPINPVHGNIISNIESHQSHKSMSAADADYDNELFPEDNDPNNLHPIDSIQHVDDKAFDSDVKQSYHFETNPYLPLVDKVTSFSDRSQGIPNPCGIMDLKIPKKKR